MATYMTELANAVALYQSTIANSRTGSGAYYSIELGYNGGANVNNPYDLELLEDNTVKATYTDGTGAPGEFQYSPAPDYFALTNPPAGS